MTITTSWEMNVLLVLGLVMLMTAAQHGTAAEERPLFELDGDTFVTFYDLPSRRFHRIRQAFVSRDFDTARHDIQVSAEYLGIEAQRAQPGIGAAMLSVQSRFREMGDNLDSEDVVAQNFDALFGRAHWLLAQHFLHLAIASRDAERYSASGQYLLACAHHMERAALWSNARISPELVRSLDRLRGLADQLQDSPSKRWIEENRPLRSAVRTLSALGEHIDRQVLLVTPTVE